MVSHAEISANIESAECTGDKDEELYEGKMFTSHENLHEFMESWSKRSQCPLAKVNYYKMSMKRWAFIIVICLQVLYEKGNIDEANGKLKVNGRRWFKGYVK